MNDQKITGILTDVRRQQPLIHCITNPISIHQCANTILAVGGRPMMAEHPREVAEITQTAGAVMLNLGNITDVRMESIRISAETAVQTGIPLVLDAVGIACSHLRRSYTSKLLSALTPTLIKGNYSEIYALYQDSYRASGVDADAALDVQMLDRCAAALAREKNTIILASGKVDIITDGKRLVHIHNGTPQLSAVTGTGCMLGALCAAYLSIDRSMDAAITACAMLGISGEKSQTPKGSGTFFVNLMDSLSTLSAEDLCENIKLEEIIIEST